MSPGAQQSHYATVHACPAGSIPVVQDPLTLPSIVFLFSSPRLNVDDVIHVLYIFNVILKTELFSEMKITFTIHSNSCCCSDYLNYIYVVALGKGKMGGRG